ncbi:hypothetical protein [Aquirufa sp.]|jgi:hypothetical protein|uniref:hypothetical protein n=1 Tax=Aquirufa sp. TaxID=2676249 RepID=UPI0037BF4D0E
MEHLISKLVSHSKYWVLCICLNSNFSTNAQSFFNLESGALFTNINDIRNGNNGTTFSLKNDFQTPVIPFLRIRVGHILNGKDHFSVLYAPLKITETGTLENDILFDGKNFKANIPIAAIYKFNSYRFTYNRRIISKDNFKFGLGLSAKIRDAGVSLKNRELLSENFGFGFAPLINLIANWDISQKAGIDFFGEFIAASKGRAIDLSLSGRYRFSKNLQGNMGYRLLEGGSNGNIRYNFIQLHSIFTSINYTFNNNNTEK